MRFHFRFDPTIISSPLLHESVGTDFFLLLSLSARAIVLPLWVSELFFDSGAKDDADRRNEQDSSD